MKKNNFFHFRPLNFLSAAVLFASFFLCPSCQKNKGPSEIKNFTFYSSDLTQYTPFTDLTAREITKKSGVFLETIYSQNSDEVSVMLANDQFPDLIYVKNDLARFIEAGAVIPLDDYIEKYGQNMKKLYGDQLVKLKYSLENPHIYSMGTFEIKKKVLEVAGNIQLQHAVLKELGYPQIKTLDDLENALLAYKAKNPYINGHETIGFSLLCDDWFWYLGLSNPGSYLTGHPDDGQWIIDQNTLKATYKFLAPEMPVFYKWLNRIYHEGLLDIESFTQKEDLFQSKLKEGIVLATSYTHWGLMDARSELAANNMENRTFAYLPVTAGPEYKDQSLKDYGFSGGWGIAITKSCKDPEAAFKFLDYMCSEEAQIILNWGVEGVTYEVTSDGKRVSLPNIPENAGIGVWIYPFPQAGNGALDSLGNILVQNSVDSIKKSYLRPERETLRAYGAEIWPDIFPSSQELGVSRHGQVWQYSLSSENTSRLNQIDNYVKQELIKMILGPEKDFDKSWEKMKSGIISMDIETVTSELDRLISQKIELWNK